MEIVQMSWKNLLTVGNIGRCCLFTCVNIVTELLLGTHWYISSLPSTYWQKGERGTVGQTTNLFTGSRSQGDKRSGHCRSMEQELLKIVESCWQWCIWSKKTCFFCIWYVNVLHVSKLKDMGKWRLDGAFANMSSDKLTHYSLRLALTNPVLSWNIDIIEIVFWWDTIY